MSMHAIRLGLRENIGQFSLLVLVNAFVGAMVAEGMYGASGAALGHMTALMLALVFPLWEFSRWRIRRKNPIVKYQVSSNAVE